jgi:16S rRNA (uracil1498-N3)-methyltransferase
MRLRRGDSLLLFDANGREWRATVTAVSAKHLSVDVTSLVREAVPPRTTIEVGAALIRPALFELAIAKCTEAGADAIVPLITEFAQRDAPSSARSARWERIAIEAAEQCGRLTIPGLSPPLALATVLSSPDPAVCLLAEASGSSLLDFLPQLSSASAVRILIGPEGGWSPTEFALARDHGAHPVSLGPNILRTETAAMVATAILAATRGINDPGRGTPPA